MTHWLLSTCGIHL